MIVAVFLGIGAVFGLIELSVVALARDHGHAGAAGPMLGLWASGSLLAGIAYGAIAWTAPAPRRFLVTVAAFALGTVLIAAGTSSLAIMTAALFVAGLANAPTLITGKHARAGGRAAERAHGGVHLAQRHAVRRHRGRLRAGGRAASTDRAPSGACSPPPPPPDAPSWAP